MSMWVRRACNSFSCRFVRFTLFLPVILALFTFILSQKPLHTPRGSCEIKLRPLSDLNLL